jgi:hypothetical protein
MAYEVPTERADRRLGDQLGTLEQGRPADLQVLERRHQDPYASVVAADPWVQLVMVDGDLTYGRADWLSDLVDPADRERLEPVLAWGTPMLLDTSYRARPTSPQRPPTLAELRAALIAHYPRSDPSSPDTARPVRTTTTRQSRSCGRERLTSPLTVSIDLRKCGSAQR